MKKISALFVILALFAMNIVSVADVHAGYLLDNSIGIDTVQNLDVSSGDGIPSEQAIQCQECSCSAGSHILVDNAKVNDYEAPSVNFLAFTDETYPSTLNSPPFQPPKA